MGDCDFIKPYEITKRSGFSDFVGYFVGIVLLISVIADGLVILWLMTDE